MNAPSNQKVLLEISKLKSSIGRIQGELKDELAAINIALDVIKDDSRAAKKSVAVIQDELVKLSKGMNMALSFIESLPDSKIELKIRK